MVQIITERIKEARKEKGWSQQEIAVKLEEKRSSYAEWEQDTIPRADILAKIASITGKPISWFFGKMDDNSSIPLDEIQSEGGKGVYNDSLSERLIKEIEARRIVAEKYYEDAKDDKKELYKALAETRATINGVLTTIATNLTDIKGDTHAGLAYQKAWVEFVAESEAKGDRKKKDEVQARMNKLLAQKLGVGPKKDNKNDVSN